MQLVVAAHDFVEKAESYSVPATVRAAARRGLDYRKKAGGRGGLSHGQAAAQGIGSGVQRASDLISGSVSKETIKRMHAFFSRHQKNRHVGAGKEPHEDRGYVAWLLWGGDSGRAWAAKMVKRFERETKKQGKKLPEKVKKSVFTIDVAKASKEHPDKRRERNARPHNREARKNYMKTAAGKAANNKAQRNYRSRHPERYSAQQKARTDGAGGHKCARCGKPAVHKHHLSYDNHANYEWLCHTHHVKAHHPKSNLKKATEGSAKEGDMTQANFVLPLKKSDSPEIGTQTGAQYTVRLDVLNWVQGLTVNGESAMQKSFSAEAQKGFDFLKGMYGDDWYEQFYSSPYYAEAIRTCAEYKRKCRDLNKKIRNANNEYDERKLQVEKGRLSDMYRDAKEALAIKMLEHKAKSAEMQKSAVLPEPGQVNTMDVNDEHGDRIRYWDTVKMGVPLTQAITTFVSEDDEEAWKTIPMGPRLRLHLQEMMQATPDDRQEHKVSKMAKGQEGNDMKKSELFEQIRGNDVDEFCKALNTVDSSEHPGSEHKETGQERTIATQGGAPANTEFNKDARSGMPNPGGEGGGEQQWSQRTTRLRCRSSRTTHRRLWRLRRTAARADPRPVSRRLRSRTRTTRP